MNKLNLFKVTRFALFFVLFITSESLSQIESPELFSLSLSEPYGVINAKENYYFPINQDVVTVKISASGIYFAQLLEVPTFKLKMQRELPKLPLRSIHVETLCLNGKIYDFFATLDLKTKKQSLYFRELNTSTLNFGENILLITSDQRIALVNTNGQPYPPQNLKRFILSVDKSNSILFVQYPLVPEDRNGGAFSSNYNEEIGMSTYDFNLNQIWSSIVKMPFRKNCMGIKSYMVDKYGAAYLLIRQYKDDSELEAINSKFEPSLSVFKIDNNGLLNEPISIENPPTNYLEYKLLDAGEDEFVLAGFYSNSDWESTGVYSIRFNVHGVSTDYHFVPFSEEVLKKYETTVSYRKKLKDNKSVLPNAIIHSIELESDSSLIFMLEECDVSMSPFDGESVAYLSAVVMKVGFNGELIWMHKIPKGQNSISTYRTGMYSMNGVNCLNILFYDNKRNSDLPENKTPSWITNGEIANVVAYQINKESGNMQKAILFNTADVKGNLVQQFSLNRMFNLPDNSVGIEFYNRPQKDLVVKISFQD